MTEKAELRQRIRTAQSLQSCARLLSRIAPDEAVTAQEMAMRWGVTHAAAKRWLRIGTEQGWASARIVSAKSNGYPCKVSVYVRSGPIPAITLPKAPEADRTSPSAAVRALWDAWLMGSKPSTRPRPRVKHQLRG